MNGPVAIVTGAAQGLGAEIARTLLAHGYRVVAADRSKRVVDTFGTAVANAGVAAVQVDLGVQSAGDELVAAALDAFGRCDAIVNNAGVGGPSQPTADLGDDEVLDVLAVNLLGAVRLSRAAMPHLRASGSGRVVNIGSVFAERPSPGDAAYGMSKAALAALTRSIALEEGPNGVTANTVAPGYILTEMHAAEAARLAEFAGVGIDEQFTRFRAEVPVGRHGTPTDIAHTVRFLLSPEASYISGQVIRVDGALSIT